MDSEINPTPLPENYLNVLPIENFKNMILLSEKGQQGLVFLAEINAVKVVIKTVKDIKKSDLQPKLELEMQMLATRPFQNICQFLGITYRNDQLCIVQEYMEKGDLDKILEEDKVNQKLSLATRLGYARDIANGMNWLHCCRPSILHRDLKTANLLMDAQGTVKVSDFGLSKFQENGAYDQEMTKRTGSALWMAPEVMLGNRFNTSLDVYSFGLVLWQLVCREKVPLFPCNPRTFNQLQEAVLRGERPVIPDHCPASLRQLIQVCWATNHEDRPSFAQVLASLDDILMDVLIGSVAGKEFWCSQPAFPISQTRTLEYQNFSAKLFKYLGVNQLDPTFAQKNKSLYMLSKERCSGQVTMEFFGDLVGWFGPLTFPNGNILDTISTTLEKPYFFGSMTAGEAVAEFNKTYPGGLIVGTFLLRFSTTRGTFSITFVSPEGLKHIRVHYNCLQANCWVAEISLAMKIEAPTFPALLALLKPYHVATPFPGQKYKVLPDPSVVGEYMGSS